MVAKGEPIAHQEDIQAEAPSLNMEPLSETSAAVPFSGISKSAFPKLSANTNSQFIPTSVQKKPAKSAPEMEFEDFMKSINDQ